MPTCPTCKSDRCGNHAACARKKAIADDRVSEENLIATQLLLVCLCCNFEEQLKKRNMVAYAVFTINPGMREELYLRMCDSLLARKNKR